MKNRVYRGSLKQFANSEEADAAIYYSDSDRVSGSDARKASVCQKRYDDLKGEIFKGFDAADIQGKTFVCSGVAAIPVKMIESWLLADKNAFDMAFGVRTCKNFPKYPELEWGDIDDINSNYPKNKMDRILECYHQMACQETFCAVAQVEELETIQSKCPISFADFYRQVSKLESGKM